MRYKDESGSIIADPDFSKGEIVRISHDVVGHHEATAEVFHMESLKDGSGEDLKNSKGNVLNQKIIDQEAIPAGDDYEDFGIFHAYSDIEVASRDAGQRIIDAERGIKENSDAMNSVTEKEAKTEEDLSTAKEDISSTQDAICDQAAHSDTKVTELEDSVCEQTTHSDSKVSELEDSICELSALIAQTGLTNS